MRFIKGTIISFLSCANFTFEKCQLVFAEVVLFFLVNFTLNCCIF